MSKEFSRDEFESLVWELLDSGDNQDPERVQLLANLMESSSEFRMEYLRLVSVHSMLEDLHLDSPGSGNTNESTSKWSSDTMGTPSPVFWRNSIVISSALLVLALIVFWIFPFDRQNSQVVVTSIEGKRIAGDVDLLFARITQAENPVWKDEQLAIGRLLGDRKLELISGVVEITFDSGATVTMSGPAQMTVVSANSALVDFGKVWADVPEPAIGFVIKTPTMRVVDLGTRFTVQVSESGESDVAVLKGEVRVGTTSGGIGSEKVVNQSQAIRVDGMKDELVGIDFSEDLSRDLQLSPYSSGTKIPFYHWGFDSPESIESGDWPEGGRHVGQRQYSAKYSTEDRGTPRISSIRGAKGNAIELNGQGAFLQTELAGIARRKPRTVCCWVRIPKNAESKHAYSFISWGSTELGRKWQLSWNAHMYVDPGVKGAFRTEIGSGYVVGTKDLRDGKWHHLASVYNGGGTEFELSDMRNRVRQYVDGKLEPVSAFLNRAVNTEVNEESFPVAMGHYVGYRSPNEGEHFESFRGAIDEMFLFEGALTPKQILRVMKENQPPEGNEIVPITFGQR